MVGGVGAGLLVVAIDQTLIGRTAFRANFLPFLLSLCLALLWWGWRQRVRHGGTWWRVVLAGVCAGLLPYTYIPARFAPFLFLLFGLSFVLPFGSSPRRECGLNCRGQVVFLGVAGLVAAPLLVYFALHPEHFFMRGRSSRSSVRDLARETLWALFWGMCGSICWPLVFAVIRTGGTISTAAYVEPMGGVLFLAWCGDGRVALASGPPIVFCFCGWG